MAADLRLLGNAAGGTLSALAPALLGTMTLALVVNLAQTRGLVTLRPRSQPLTRLSPKSGLKRVISPRSLWDSAKNN